MTYSNNHSPYCEDYPENFGVLLKGKSLEMFPDYSERIVDDDTKRTIFDVLKDVYKTESKLPLTCLQTIMFKDGMYYGYGDFRRVDALASGNINDW